VAAGRYRLLAIQDWYSKAQADMETMEEQLWQTEQERNHHQSEVTVLTEKLNDRFSEQRHNLTKQHNEAIRQLKQQHPEQLLQARPDLQADLLKEVLRLQRSVDEATTYMLSFATKSALVRSVNVPASNWSTSTPTGPDSSRA
jgi:F0F1-type ATP synthase membrane subunit b/b'